MAKNSGQSRSRSFKRLITWRRNGILVRSNLKEILDNLKSPSAAFPPQMYIALEVQRIFILFWWNKIFLALADSYTYFLMYVSVVFETFASNVLRLGSVGTTHIVLKHNVAPIPLDMVMFSKADCSRHEASS